MATRWTVTMDCADPARLAAFWRLALGYVEASLTAAGATVIREDIQAGTPDHVVMADPEGNEFCVL
jgi:hypothetical protein